MKCECDLFPFSLLAPTLFLRVLYTPLLPSPHIPPSELLKITVIWRISFEKNLLQFHSSISIILNYIEKKWLPFFSMMLIMVTFLTVACLGERGRCFRAPAELKTFVLSTEALQHKHSCSYPVLNLFNLFRNN